MSDLRPATVTFTGGGFIWHFSRDLLRGELTESHVVSQDPVNEKSMSWAGCQSSAALSGLTLITLSHEGKLQSQVCYTIANEIDNVFVHKIYIYMINIWRQICLNFELIIKYIEENNIYI